MFTEHLFCPRSYVEHFTCILIQFFHQFHALLCIIPGFMYEKMRIRDESFSPQASKRWSEDLNLLSGLCHIHHSGWLHFKTVKRCASALPCDLARPCASYLLSLPVSSAIKWRFQEDGSHRVDCKGVKSRTTVVARATC